MKSRFYPEYVDRGFSDIVVTSSCEEEESGGYQTEHKYETAVAKRYGKVWRIEVHEKTKFGPRAGRDIQVHTAQITESEYEKCALGKQVVDTPEAKQRLLKERQQEQSRAEAEQKLRASAPRCLVHRTKMQVRSGPYGPFWGCSKYPRCKQTRNMSSADLV